MAANRKMNLLYLIGCALVVLGFCLPLLKIGGSFLALKFSVSLNGFSIVNSLHDSDNTFRMLMAVLIFVGAICEIIIDYFTGNLLGDIVSLASSILGAIILLCNTSSLGIKVGLNCISFGFYVLVAGWIVALVGIILKAIKK